MNAKGQVKYHATLKLWYYLRAIDGQGAGRTDLDIAEAAQTLECSTYTILRWCVWGMQLGIFRSVIRVSVGKFRVYYAGLKAVAKQFGITDLGASLEIQLDDLKNLPTLTTEVEA